MIYNNKQGYSVIISMLLIGFLLILTTSVFNLVLKEYQDNKGMGDSIKAFAGAEASQELALLKIRQEGYGVDNQIEHSTESGSIILAEDSSDRALFQKNIDVFLSYNLNVTADYDGTNYKYSEILDHNGYSIIPLFVQEDGETPQFVQDYLLNINSGVPGNLVWNLIARDEGISNTGDSLGSGSGKIIDITRDIDGNILSAESVFTGSTVGNFLSTRTGAYLILYNSSNIAGNLIDFTLTSSDKFSKPQANIISSAQVGDYRHNLETNYNNTEFLNMLKYAVFNQ